MLRSKLQRYTLTSTRPPRHDNVMTDYVLTFDCRSSIETTDRTYVGTLNDKIEVVNVRAI
jgi:hypothetical protein